MNAKETFRQFASLIFLLMIQSCFLNVQSAKKNSTSTDGSINEMIEEYHQDVIGVTKKGMIDGKEYMRLYLVELQNKYGFPKEFKSHIIEAVNSSLEYEIGLLQFNKNNKFVQLIIWNRKNALRQKIFEVMYEEKGTKEIPEGIAKAREKWIQLCNDHNALKLVKELYTADAIYFNRGRIIRGQNNLAQEYSYMNNPAYKLQLVPEHIEMVDGEIAFELGRCRGSYNLPYLLVWRKQENNSWKIYLDSNY